MFSSIATPHAFSLSIVTVSGLFSELGPSCTRAQDGTALTLRSLDRFSGPKGRFSPRTLALWWLKFGLTGLRGP